MLDAVGAGEDGGGLFRLFVVGFGGGGGAGFGGGVGEVGEDAELDHEVKHYGYGLAVFDGWGEFGFADGGYRVFVEAEADGAGDGDFAGFAIDANDGVIKGHSGDSGVLGEVIGVGLKAGKQVGLLIDHILPQHGRVGGLVVGFCGDSLVVELPEVGHGGHHSLIEALGKDGVDCGAEQGVGVGLGGGGGDGAGVGWALGLGGGGDGGFELVGFAWLVELGSGCGGGLAGSGGWLCLLCFFFGRLFLFLWIDHDFAVDGDFDGLLIGSDADFVVGLFGVLVGQLLVEVEAVTDAFEFDLVLGEAHMVKLEDAESVRALRGVADDAAVLVKVERVAKVARAQVELLADELALELVFCDGADLRLLGLGLDCGLLGCRGGDWRRGGRRWSCRRLSCCSGGGLWRGLRGVWSGGWGWRGRWCWFGRWGGGGGRLLGRVRLGRLCRCGRGKGEQCAKQKYGACLRAQQGVGWWAVSRGHGKPLASLYQESYWTGAEILGE